MKYQKFNRYEKKEIRSTNIARAMSGKGLYIYENSSKHAELTLPRPTNSGVRKVAAGRQFQGDDYYMQLVRSGELRLIQCLDDGIPKGDVMNENTLILDQPQTVTPQGVVENVVVTKQSAKKKPTAKKNEATQTPSTPQPVLLIEAPVGAITLE